MLTNRGGGRRERLADLIALVYHEARNVRHLIRAGHIESQRFSQLVSLSANRNEAWFAIQELRDKAAAAQTAAEAASIFERRFGLDVADLVELYANDHWRSSAYGGNAWHAISLRVAELLTALQREEAASSDARLAEISRMRHNTGTVGEKLENLDRASGGLEIG